MGLPIGRKSGASGWSEFLWPPTPLARPAVSSQLRLNGCRPASLCPWLRNLAHFLEDDSAPGHTMISDDGPRDSTSDPEPSPITLHISNLLIHRTDDGAFSIGSDTLTLFCTLDRSTAHSTQFTHYFAGSGGLEAGVDGTPHQPEVRARLESGPCAAAHSPLAETNGFLQLRLNGYRASFLMSSLRNLAHFLEDDSAPQVLPMEISVRDTHIGLKDDGPRDNTSDPEPSPITLHISNLLIHRTDDGAFSIGVESFPEAGPKKDVPLIDSYESPVLDILGVISSIPKATQTTNSPSPTPSAPDKEQLLLEENECLKLELSKAKMALAEAQMEKDSLLHRIKSLRVNSS
ncbi:hypothetical protein DPEC_G00114850 [Dallia pectoralis]|uniref:Uncharacterized protein n=1 Tax=Dallia pectoralis TaxID=75939 RepID=A0ACC2GU37_DALPE|nr:hypothetical protein DPEC_G00114850 [Dallia pectoralis]